MASYIASLMMKIGTDTGELEKGLQKAKGNMNSFSKDVSKVGGEFKNAFMGAVTGLLAVGSAVEFTKKAIDATQGSADKFEEIMGGVETSTEKFFQMVSTGDFSNFTENLLKAAEAGREYVSALDEVNERMLGLKLNKSTVLPEQSALMETFRDKGADPIKRQEALNKYKQNAIDLATKEFNISKDLVKAEEDRLTGLGLSAEGLKYLYENYEDNLDIIRTAGDKLNRLKEIQTEIGTSGTLEFGKRNQLFKEGEDILNSLTGKEKLYFNLLMNNNKVKEDDLQRYIDALVKQNTTEAAINQIDVENLKIQTNITKEIQDQNKELEKQQGIKKMAEQKANSIKSISTNNIKIPTLGKPFTTPGLQASNNTQDSIDKVIKSNQQIEKANEQLSMMEELGMNASSAINTLGNSLSQMADDGKISIKELVSVTLSGIRQILIAKFAEGIANLIVNGTKKGLLGLGLAAAGAIAFTAMWKNMIPQFANGTLSAPGGYSLVGERGAELVYLPQNSQVIPNIQTKNLFGNSEVRFIIEGNNLVGIINKFNQKQIYF